MNHSIYKLLSLKNSRLIMGMAVLLASTFILVHPQKAWAINENEDNIPQDIRTIMATSGCRGLRYAQFPWLSAPFVTSSNIIERDANSGDVAQVWLNNVTAVCNNNITNDRIRVKDKIVTRSRVTFAQVESGPAGARVVGLVNSFTDEHYQRAYDNNYRYIKDWDAPYNGLFPERLGFDIAGLGGLAPRDQPYEIKVKVDVRKIHWVTGGERYQCVEPADVPVPGVARSLDDTTCVPFSSVFTIYIHVKPNRGVEYPDARIDNINCAEDAIAGWAIDPDTPNTPISVDFYEGQLGTGTFVGSATASRPPNAGETLPYGNPNGRFLFRFQDHPSLYNGAHNLYAYAIDSEGGPFQNLNDGEGGPLSFTYRSVCGPIPSDTYTATPLAQVEFDDDESPTQADFNTGISSGGPFTATISRSFYVERDGVKLPAFRTESESRTMTSFNYPDPPLANPVGVLNMRVGDKLCVDVTVRPRTVRVERGGATTVVDSEPYTETGCDQYVNRPYVSFYGNDIKAGGDVETVGDICKEEPVSSIGTFRRGTDGSSTQLAAFALGTIYNEAPRSRGLTTALYGGGNPARDSLTVEYFGSHGTCTHDFYGDGANASPWNGFGGAEGKKKATGPIDLGVAGIDTTVARSQNIFLYVDGNVNIVGNITMDQGPWASLSEIPSLYVVASGNITIDKSVTKIAGVFIAQNAGSTISTCSSRGVTVAENQMYNDCGKQLVIEGAFIAKKVVFGRTFGSLRDAPGDGGLARACSTADAGHPPRSTCAAEVFRYHPGLYLGEAPDTSGTDVPSEEPYQFVTSLPPIL